MSQQKRYVKKKLPHKSYFVFYLYLLFVLLSLFVVASYTWFTLSRTPRVSNMNVYITSATGLELSADPTAEEWQLQLDFWETGSIPTSLRPVTWSEARDGFLAAAYGADGRLMHYDAWYPLSDTRNANNTSLDGYYMKATFYARSGQSTEVTLSPAVLVDQEGTQGSGTYVIGVASWDLENLIHINNGKGAESSIRMGLRMTYVDQNGTPISERGPMYIYEPNADRHVGSTTGYIPTPSIDGTPTLVSEDRMILQTASGWGEVDPAEITKIQLTLGEFIQNPPLFSLTPGDIVQIDLYIWLEGQDVDCTNAMNGAQIMANLQFTGTTEAQSGMVPFE